MRSPKHDAIGGAILSKVRREINVGVKTGPQSAYSPGSRPYLWQQRTRVHMKEPRNALERHAAVIDDAATIANLRGVSFVR